MAKNDFLQLVTHFVGDRCPGGHYDEPERVVARIDCLEAALQDSVNRMEEQEAVLKAACSVAGVAYGPDAVMRMAKALRNERKYKRTGAYAQEAKRVGSIG